jgi:glycosyltransferase involved in cell wall biosynthesis
MAAPILSICIPSYNRGTLALEALAALDAPGFLPFSFEVVLVDNGSDAGSYDAVRRFAPHHYALRYVRLAATVPILHNVWGSLRRAAGEFCLYLADDDRLIPEAVAEIVETMAANPDLLATFSAWQYIDVATGAITRPGAMLDEVTFDWRSASAPLAMVVDRMLPPEVGVYRTIALTRALLPSRLFYWPYVLIDRLLKFGSVRFSPRSFYGYVSDRAGVPDRRATFSRTMGLQHWESINRALDLWLRYLPPEWLGQPNHDSPYHRSKRTYLSMAFQTAARNARFLEAFEIALLLKAYGQHDLPLLPFDVERVCSAAALEALREIAQSVPEVAGLAIQGFDDGYRDELAAMMAGAAGRAAPVVLAKDLAADALGRHMVLTRRDFERRQLLGRGSPPGLTYSLEDLMRVFCT